MLETAVVFVIGFSVVAAGILLIAYLGFLGEMQKSAMSRLSVTVLLAALALLQFYHYAYLENGIELTVSAGYVRLLILTPIAFFFFSRSLLMPDRALMPLDALHLLPLVAGEFLPGPVAVNLAFLIGAAYSLWFAQKVYGMRDHGQRLVHERFFFSVFAALAVIVLLIGLSVPYVSLHAFHVSYALAIALGLILVVAALISFPGLATEFSNAAAAAYANSTLGGLDVDALLATLDRLMREDRIYRNEALSLSSLADVLDISPHQLSELINTRHKVGFSRFVREFRIEEACRLLREDPDSTVLTISLATGFQSQSNFYAAFKEITGTSPGSYRKRADAKPSA